MLKGYMVRKRLGTPEIDSSVFSIYSKRVCVAKKLRKVNNDSIL